MDAITLATTALSLVGPFLEKTGEGVARKVGEDIWNFIKSPFVKDGKLSSSSDVPVDIEILRDNLIERIEADENFKNDLLSTVKAGQQELIGNFQQNIENREKVEKQINIQSNSGNIQM